MSRKTEQERFWAKVNKTDGCWIWTAAQRNGYGIFSTAHSPSQPRIMVSAHRYTFEMENGPIPEGLVVDHLCHTPACVRPSHLRVATHKENLEHRAGPNKGNPSGALGVARSGNRWSAGVTHLGQYLHAGNYDTVHEAELAVRKLRLSVFTHNEADRVQVQMLSDIVRSERKFQVWSCIAELKASVAA